MQRPNLNQRLNMKLMNRIATLVVVAGFLAAAPALWAGECCTKTTAKVEAGKACDKCVTGKCCKKAAAEVAAKGKAKTCEVCAAKAKEAKKPS